MVFILWAYYTAHDVPCGEGPHCAETLAGQQVSYHCLQMPHAMRGSPDAMAPLQDSGFLEIGMHHDIGAFR